MDFELIQTELAIVVLYYVPTSTTTRPKDFHFGPFHPSLSNPIPLEATLQQQVSSPFLYKLLETYTLLATPNYKTPPISSNTDQEEVKKRLKVFCNTHNLMISKVVKPGFECWNSKVNGLKYSDYLALGLPNIENEERRTLNSILAICFQLNIEIARIYKTWWEFSKDVVVKQEVLADLKNQLFYRSLNPSFYVRGYFNLQISPIKASRRIEKPTFHDVRNYLSGNYRKPYIYTPMPTDSILPFPIPSEPVTLLSDP